MASTNSATLALNATQSATTCHPMTMGDRFRALRQNPVARLVLFLIGCVLLIVTPLIGVLPGPGGVFTFAIGLGLVLQNSMWARRRYVHFKRKSPKMGGWADWGLRRRSAKRRQERARINDSQP
jgi:hypothetical protein